MSYKIAAADEYLAITGIGIQTVKITKAAWVWPLQRCTRFSVQPHDYAMDLQAMTFEKLQFALPVVFTVGPDVNSRGANTSHDSGHEESEGHREDRGDALVKYAMLLADSAEGKGSGKGSGGNSHKDHVASIIKGIIEGETRVLVSSLTMEEIFAKREVFKQRIFRNIQSELSQFGLKIYNSNVKELKDAPKSNYFESLSRKAHEGATNQARIDVAEAQLRGNVGEAKRRGEQDREIAKIHAETAVQKTERDIERASAEARLKTRETALNRDVEIAQVTAQRTLESTDEDLKRDVEVKRAAAEMERLRARDVVKATIERESQQQAVDGAAYRVSAEARAQQDAKQRLADAQAYATRTQAEAAAFSTLKAAEADAGRRIKEAEGISALADAHAKMVQVHGQVGFLQYLMIKESTYVKLAQANATAVAGMEPKISVWNTGSGNGSGSGGDSTEVMRNVYQMLPPLMSTIHDQTGITLPEWQFGRLNAEVQAVGNEKKAQLNGAK